MSSNEDDYNDAESAHERETSQNSKKRRIQRACDVCRRKKIRCDGVQMPSNQCSNCLAYNFECTYVEAAKKRGPPKAYVESLENRLEKMETLLRRLKPDIDLAKELGLNGSSTSALNPPQPTEPPRSFSDAYPSSTEVAIQAIRKWRATPEFSPPQNAEDREHLELADNLKKMHVDSRNYRFFGKSSEAMFVKTAIDLKQEFTGRETNLKRVIIGERRPEFWKPFPWEDTFASAPTPEFKFPEPDLLVRLIDSYFTNINIYMPLLHRPTFERAVRDQLHFRDELFAAVVLLVCAIGSRYVDDPRVLLDGVDSWHSSGWKYFNQVQVVRKSFLQPPSLYVLQFHCLSVEFLQGSSAPHSCWTMVGIGIRLAQDVGAHRRKPNQTLTVEDELWKRAFWCLVCMDRVFSTALGRPCAIQEEDYDVEMPTECDDEYWEHRDPSQAFRQPPGRPSIISAFNAYIKLNLLLSIALRTIYAINKSKILLGFGGDQWEYHIVAELDSALNQWVDSVPDHLRWDPKRENKLWFNQSVNLYTQYYLVQILVHRPFISSPKKPSPLSFPSLAICTNAARSASHVMDVQRRRGGMLMPFAHITAFTAGIVLLLNIWGGKRSGLSTDTNKEMADVYKCMQVLKACENRWHSAGRIWDILYELASVGELPLPGGSPSASNKRERDADSPIPTWEGGSIPLESRTIAGSRRVSANTPLNSDMFKPSPSTSSPVPMGTLGLGENSPSPSNPYTPPDGMQLFSLPVYSDELGRLPLHGQVKFSTVAPHLNSNPVQPQVMEWYGQPSQPPQPRPTQSAGEGLIGGLGGMGTEFMQSTFYDYSPFTGSTLGVVGPSSSAGSLNAPAPAYRSRFSPPSAEGRHPGTHAPTTHGQGRSFDPSGVGGGYMSSTGQTSHDSSIGAPMSGGLPLSLDNDTFAMWSNTPSGFELDDWGTYLTNVSELTQTMNSRS